MLLYFLAVEARPIPRRELAELLWGNPRASNLRQELHVLGALDGAETWLDAGTHVELHVETDLRAFREYLAAGDFEAALACAGSTAGGPSPFAPLLEGIDAGSVPSFEDWLQTERARFEDEVREGLQGHASELEAAGRAGAAVDVLQRLLGSDPLNESAHRAVMRLEFRRGRFQAALTQYDRCRKALHEQLGVEPLPETQALARSVTVATTNESAPVPASAMRMPTALLRPPVLVGRELAWAAMERAWLERKTIFLSGPPGVGKTRLMLDFARSKGSHLLLQGFPRDRDVPYAATDRAIGVILRSLPDLRVPAWAAEALETVHRLRVPAIGKSPRGAGEGRVASLTEAWLELMDRVAQRVTTLPADDVHDFDAASAEVAMVFTRFVAQQRREVPMARSLAAFRADEATPAFLEGVEAAVAAGAAVWIELEPLTQASVAELIAGSGVTSAVPRAARVHAYAGGNPLFVLEVLKGMWLNAHTSDEDEGVALGPTDRLRLVVGRRLNRLSAEARGVLDALAILAPDGSLDLVAGVAEQPVQQVVSGLAELEALQLVDDDHIVHGLVEDVVHASMSFAERRYRHRLAALAYRAEDADSARIATHYENAGDRRAALRWWERAAASYRRADLASGTAHAAERIEDIRAGARAEDARAHDAQAKDVRADDARADDAQPDKAQADEEGGESGRMPS